MHDGIDGMGFEQAVKKGRVRKIAFDKYTLLDSLPISAAQVIQNKGMVSSLVEHCIDMGTNKASSSSHENSLRRHIFLINFIENTNLKNKLQVNLGQSVIGEA
jgi:hypothetical protein